MAVERRQKRSLSTVNNPALNLSWDQGQPRISYLCEKWTILYFAVLQAQQGLKGDSDSSRHFWYLQETSQSVGKVT